MAERRTIVYGRVLRHSGIFNAKELYTTIDRWFADNGFSDSDELEHLEKIYKDKKEIEILYQPTKKINPFSKIELRVVITISGLTRKVIEVDGRSVGVNDGDLEICFDGFLTTDFENRYQNEPRYFLWRTVIDKFFKKGSQPEGAGMVSDYIQELYNHLRTFLQDS